MKSISHLSIILMSTLLLISTNSICMEEQYKKLTSSYTPDQARKNVTHTYDFDQSIYTIEQQLVIKEIEKHGLETVYNTIKNTPSPVEVENKLNPIIRFSTALKINSLFHKSEATINPLAKHIFDKIEETEQKRGYIPEEINSTYATNYLSPYIRYWWIENNSKSAVRVEANLQNKEKLLEIINIYKKENNHNNNNQNGFLYNGPNSKICLAFISATCLLYYLCSAA